MHRDTPLKLLLTLTTCLLTADLWTRLVDRPLLADTAQAQSRSTNRGARNQPLKGVGSSQSDAVAQRKEMVTLLKQLNAEIVGLRADLKVTTIKVEVTNQPKAIHGK